MIGKKILEDGEKRYISWCVVKNQCYGPVDITQPEHTIRTVSISAMPKQELLIYPHIYTRHTAYQGERRSRRRKCATNAIRESQRDNRPEAKEEMQRMASTFHVVVILMIIGNHRR